MLKKRIFFNIENDSIFKRYLYYGEVIFFSGLIIYYFIILILSGIDHADGFAIGQSIVLSRVGNPYSGHTISWLAILVSALIIRLKTPYKEYPIYYAIQSLLAFMLVTMITEGMWHVFYFAVQPSIDLFTLPTKLEIIMGITAAYIAGTYKFFKRDSFWIAVFILLNYFVFWSGVCTPSTTVDGQSHMPVSLDIGIEKSKSIYYSNSMVNFLEVTQWILGMASFSLAYRGKYII